MPLITLYGSIRTPTSIGDLQRGQDWTRLLEIVTGLSRFGNPLGADTPPDPDRPHGAAGLDFDTGPAYRVTTQPRSLAAAWASA